MIQHILVPLDGSDLAESVFPHVLAMAQALNAKVSLLHVIERKDSGWQGAVDPLEWHVKKTQMQNYIENRADDLQQKGIKINFDIKEGNVAENIINYANEEGTDLIILSSHGQSGLSNWNVSSVVQKVMMGVACSLLIVRAQEEKITSVEYKNLFVGLDCSPQAEFILPLASSLAGYYKAKLTLATVVKRPEILNRFPLSPEDQGLLEKLIVMSEAEAKKYLEKITAQFSAMGVDLQTNIRQSENASSTLMDMADETEADLVLLSARGHGSEGRHPFGSMAINFIVYGNRTTLVMQNLPVHQPKRIDNKSMKRGSKE